MEERKMLEEGEILCPKCGGKGSLDVPGEPDLRKICHRCDGNGKMDWVSAVMGKPTKKRSLTGRWRVDVSKDIKAFFNETLEKDIIDAIASDMAKNIDKQIMEDLLKGSNKMKNTSFSIHKQK
jgi:hypothetical protein